MKITVIGAGAMGSIYGCRLSLTNEVTLIDTNASLIETIDRNGIVLEENGKETVYHPRALTKADSVPDLIILFTKSLYSKAALDGIKDFLGPETYLMSLQNGAGHERLLSQYVPRERVIIGTTEDNGAVLAPGRIHHGGKGVTNIQKNPIEERIAKAFDSCGFTVRIHDDISSLVWNKLMTNVSLSALSAVLQCDMSFIAEDEHAWKVCTALIHEAVLTAASQGIAIDEVETIEKVRNTSLSNKGGYTSIMMDIKAHRRTEVDTITGAVVAAAHENGVCVPHHEMMLDLIHALEARKD